jgi:hypothetical protein
LPNSVVQNPKDTVMRTKEDFPLPLEGGCRCGRIRYRVTAAPSFIFACHCSDCQQLASSAFSLGMAVPDAGFELRDGDAPRCWAKTASSGRESRQYTCPTCAGWTHTRTDSTPGITIVRPTTLDDHAWVRPVGQIFTRSALPWALMPVQFSYETEFEDPSPLQRAFAIGGIRPAV